MRKGHLVVFKISESVKSQRILAVPLDCYFLGLIVQYADRKGGGDMQQRTQGQELNPR